MRGFSLCGQTESIGGAPLILSIPQGRKSGARCILLGGIDKPATLKSRSDPRSFLKLRPRKEIPETRLEKLGLRLIRCRRRLATV
jgi:hypothetical protein